jgi:hypothetical protein
MAYDPIRGRVVMVPGPNVIGPTTWEWDGSNWTERYAPANPAPYGQQDLMWDSVGQRILMLNGSSQATVWEWHPTDATWIRISIGCTPSLRGGAAVAFDSAKDQVVYFGGSFNPGTLVYDQDLWRWAPDGFAWREYAQSGTWPSGRDSAKFVYDAVRGRLLMFAGVEQGSILDELWELRY